MIKIRKGKVNDLKAVYELIKELAVYEKASAEVVVTLEDYRKYFESNIFEFIVAESDGAVVGMALYYTAFSTWKGKMCYLEDFVVKEVYRNKGIGQMLFDELIEISRASGARLLKWQVLDWNESAIKFYKKNDALIEGNWYNGKLFL